MDQDAEESLERASADVEMLLSAFEQEVTTDDATPETFPLHATLHFSPTASCRLEWNRGYPVSQELQVVSSRASSSQEKLRLEHAVTAFRHEAAECLEQQVEAGLVACSAALEAWNDYAEHDVTVSESAESSVVATNDQNPSFDYQWLSGEPLTDRKSTFQAHVCCIECDLDIRPALAQLFASSNKFHKATHNMLAWRVCHDGVWKHDNDDDGEDAAGSRLAHLLAIRNEDGVLVVVSRWFGGIHLGPKRFAHITNVARKILDHFHQQTTT